MKAEVAYLFVTFSNSCPTQSTSCNKGMARKLRQKTTVISAGTNVGKAHDQLIDLWASANAGTIYETKFISENMFNTIKRIIKNK